jgi:hypothetical protein
MAPFLDCSTSHAKKAHKIDHLLDREAMREHDRLGAAIAAGCEQFERAAAGGGMDVPARVAAWVAYRRHWTCLRDDDAQVEPTEIAAGIATGRLSTCRRARRLRAS